MADLINFEGMRYEYGFSSIFPGIDLDRNEIQSHAKLIPEGTGLTKKEWIQQDIKKQRETLDAR